MGVTIKIKEEDAHSDESLLIEFQGSGTVLRTLLLNLSEILTLSRNSIVSSFLQVINIGFREMNLFA